MIKANFIKRIFMISDIHFGVRSNSIEWLDIHKDYFYNFFIPLLETNKKEGDVLFVLGDVFESRQTINILILNEALTIFKKLSEILPVYVIIGNHDCYRKSTTDINSAVIFKNLKNVTVFDETEIIEATNGIKLLMMPWQETIKKELETVKNNDADYLFCHSQFGGINFNKKVTIDEGMDIKEVSKFKRVYSGHIHYTQKLKNINMIGCIFQLTRSDINNKKGVFLLDLETNSEVFYENNHSPIFLKYKIDELTEMTHGDFQEKIKNNFVDIIVEGDWISAFPFSQLIDSVSGYMRMNYVLSALQKDYDIDNEELEENINIEELTKTYIDSFSYTDHLKKSLVDASNRLYKKAIKYLQEKTYQEDIFN